MCRKSIPKRHMNPTIGFDVLVATFDDLINEIKAKELPLLDLLQYYLQKFNATFFNHELGGAIFLTLWNEHQVGFEQMMVIRQQSVFQKQELCLQDLKDMMIVYDPPMYCFCTSNPFKYMNKPILDKKMNLFKKGIELLFGIETRPIFYPF